MSTSQTHANVNLDADYGSGSPATLYAALATTAPVTTGTGSLVEPTGSQYGNYARVAITNNNTNWPAASAGAKSNGTTFTFPSSTGGAGSPVVVTHLVFITTSSGAGTIIDALALPSSTSIAIGTALSFPASSVTITEG